METSLRFLSPDSQKFYLRHHNMKPVFIECMKFCPFKRINRKEALLLKLILNILRHQPK